MSTPVTVPGSDLEPGPGTSATATATGTGSNPPPDPGMSAHSVERLFQLPIIDLSSPDKEAMADAVVSAARRFGFLYIKNWGPVLTAAAEARAKAEPVIGIPPSPFSPSPLPHPDPTGQAPSSVSEFPFQSSSRPSSRHHPVPTPLSKPEIDNMFALSARFFAQPESVKRQLSIKSTSSGANCGWTGYGDEQLDPEGVGARRKNWDENQVSEKPGRIGDPKEAFNIGEFRPLSRHIIAHEPSTDHPPPQPLGPVLGPHRSEITAFSQHCQDLCLFLLRLFAVGLKIEDDSDGSKEENGVGKTKDDHNPEGSTLVDAQIAAPDGGNVPEPRGADWIAYWHDPRNGPSGTVLRLLYYPAIPWQGQQVGSVEEVGQDGTESIIRAGAHSDYGSITLLFQQEGQPGLQVLIPDHGDSVANGSEDNAIFDCADSSGVSEPTGLPSCPRSLDPKPDRDPRHSNQSWFSVAVNPENDPVPPILVNVGDLLSFWTGGYLRSTVHRVVTPVPSKSHFLNSRSDSSPGTSFIDRYSIAYFCHPINSTPLAPIPSRLVQEHRVAASGSNIVIPNARPPDGLEAKEPQTAEEHLQQRLKKTYL